MYMQDWIKKLDGFLVLNDHNILDYAGKVSPELTMQLASEEYEKYHKQRLKVESTQADKQDFDFLEKQNSGQDKGRKSEHI